MRKSSPKWAPKKISIFLLLTPSQCRNAAQNVLRNAARMLAQIAAWVAAQRAWLSRMVPNTLAPGACPGRSLRRCQGCCLTGVLPDMLAQGAYRRCCPGCCLGVLPGAARNAAQTSRPKWSPKLSVIPREKLARNPNWSPAINKNARAKLKSAVKHSVFGAKISSDDFGNLPNKFVYAPQ